ncbi:hypothetical protein DSM112329_05061 [Paraconexibacter sp. AEG42_29]|uniref:Uncharacterized protein n=1 Tax=Paraconexibacter sp. AEG42_29 TaxID=2997339 RepID=A0AAU7B3N6_9ACTN
MSVDPAVRSVQKSLRLWAAIRIGYGVVAIARPDVMFKVLRMPEHPDARGFNAFLGSRDIVVGLFSLRARDPQRIADAILLNQANEVIDSVVIAQELRAGRRGDIFSVVGVVFNAYGWLTWIKARKALR